MLGCTPTQTFTGSSLLGTKSLAMQAGIPPQRQPDQAFFIGGRWTLCYTAPTQPQIPPAPTRQHGAWLGALGLAFILVMVSVVGASVGAV